MYVYIYIYIYENHLNKLINIKLIHIYIFAYLFTFIQQGCIKLIKTYASQ